MRIEKLGERGVGIGHLRAGGREGKVVMAPFSAPGDVAEVRILHETSSYARARVTGLRERSRERVDPPCPYFGACGGCSLQHLGYSWQIEHKREILREIFRSFAREVPVEPVAPSPRELGYRNKLQMQAGSRGGRLVAGFYRAQSHEIVPVDSCLLQSDAANALARDAVEVLRRHGVRAHERSSGRGELRDIVIREASAGDGTLLTLVTSVPRIRGEDSISRELFRRHASLRGFYLFHNPHETEYVFKDGEQAGLDSRRSPLRRIHGGTLREKLLGCELETSPLSFFQVNAPQAENMLRRIALELGEGRRGRLVDAYAGVGALSIPLASRFAEVVAVESVRHSCDLARTNARRNGLSRYRVMHGDAAELLERACAEGPTDVIFVDPPRSGLSPEAARAIARSGVPSVYYLSCEPSTQARDLDRLAREGRYRVTRIAPFDMFPQTFHVECLVVLGKERP